MAVATTGSPNTVPHSPTLRLLVSRTAPSLVAAAHQLEEQMRGVGFERQIAEFVDDQELRLGERASRSSSLPSACALASAATSVVAATNYTECPARWLRARARRQRSILADAGRPEQQYVLAMGHPTHAGELAHLPRIDRGLCGEVEAGEIADDGKRASLPAISTRRSSLRAISPARTKGRGSRASSVLADLLRRAARRADRVRRSASIASAYRLDDRERLASKPPPSSASYSPSERSHVPTRWREFRADDHQVPGTGRKPVRGWLLDTNVVSACRRPKPAAAVAEFVSAQPGELLFTTDVTFGEIRLESSSCEDAGRRAEIHVWLDRTLRPLFANRVLAITEDVIVRWKAMAVEGQKRGHTFGQPDLFIAAIAALEDLVVVTRDTRRVRCCWGSGIRSVVEHLACP